LLDQWLDAQLDEEEYAGDLGGLVRLLLNLFLNDACGQLAWQGSLDTHFSRFFLNALASEFRNEYVWVYEPNLHLVVDVAARDHQRIIKDKSDLDLALGPLNDLSVEADARV
jgi:hypothetical protein